ncbi:MAG: acetyl esterase, partial [Eggerthellaceae bacterium]
MNKLDVLARINPQMKAILAKEATLAGDANDTSVGFDIMRENYVLGREFWVEGGPVMKLSFDEELTGPHGPMAVRFYYPTDEALAGKEAQSPTTPVIVYVHGGGFVLGNLDTHDR